MAYDPSEGRMRVRMQPAFSEDRITESAWIDHRLATETMGGERAQIEGNSLIPGRQRPRIVGGKIRTGGDVGVDLEPEGLAPYFALYQGHAATPFDLGGGAWRHVLTTTEADLDFRARHLQARVYRDDLAIQNAYGMRVAGFNFGAQVDQPWTGSLNLLATRGDYSGPPVQVTGTSENPYLRGMARLDLREGASTLSVRVSSVVEGDVEILVSKDADPFGATAVAVTAGRWAPLVLSADGTAVGDPGPVEILWPDTSGLSVGDEWAVPLNPNSPWVAALPPIDKLVETETTVLLDGEEFTGKFESLSLTASVATAEHEAGVGGVWPNGVAISGRRSIQWAIDKRMVSNYFQLRLEAFEPVHIDITITSAVRIAGGTIPYRCRFVSPHCTLSGKRPTLTDPNTQKESYSIDATPASAPDAEGFVDDLTIVLDNGLPSLD